MAEGGGVGPLPSPLNCRLLDRPRSETILNHRILVNLDWWNRRIREYRLPGGPISGIDASGEVATAGRAWIRRGDLFALGSAAVADAENALALLWHSLAWGTGEKPRQCDKRLRTVAADWRSTASLLRRTAGQARDGDPVGAYGLLYPGRHRYAIKFLGSAFFTKYLYFASGDAAEAGALILDDRVAAALKSRCGWTTLRVGGYWPSPTYERYVELLQRCASEESRARGRQVHPDEVERCLFQMGGA